jgi:catechol 2,3-dioxygenase-like lactoylglutathione lyase family enzyme
MAQFKVLGTNHTSFTVSNLDRAIAFYRDALGFAVTSKAPRDPKAIQQITGVPGAEIMVVYVEAPGGHRVELIEYLAPEGRGSVRPQPCDVGFAHVAFDVDDLEAAIAAAEAHEVRPIGATVSVDQGPNAGGKVAYLRDPDGIVIELLQLPKK